MIFFPFKVITATVKADTTEYWGSNGDAELVITVSVDAKDWTDLTVMVGLPDGSVGEATTTDTDANVRSYTYTVTNLFIEDAGQYSFYTFKLGSVSSELQIVTVYSEYSPLSKTCLNFAIVNINSIQRFWNAWSENINRLLIMKTDHVYSENLR